MVSVHGMTPRGNAIGLVVTDLKASVAFYERLGLTFALDDDHHVEAALGGVRFMLDTEESVKGFHPGWTAPTGGPRAGIAFECDSPAEVDAVYAELTGAGNHGVLEPWDAPWGQRYACLHDPDGNGVDLYAPLPAQG
jgi:catechol 2,3-dioxygenase-like lactoylglutathione lyase family enzyme